MNIHSFLHVPFEDLGGIEKWANSKGHALSVTKFYDSTITPDIDNVDWLIIMGGNMNIHEEEKYPWLVKEKQFIKDAINADKVVIGICLGAQLIADALGSKIYPAKQKEIGWLPVNFTEEAHNFDYLSIFPEQLTVFQWHGDTFDTPENAVRVAKSAVCKNQGFVYNNKVIALQFHIEVNDVSVDKLIENCSDEIEEYYTVQSAEEMRKYSASYKKNQRLLEKMLNRLEIKFGY